jgi:hypothetical protein
VLDEAELRLMSPEQRARIARTLAALDAPRPFDDPKARKRRKLALTLAIGCCIFLAAWIGVLAVTLPSRYSAGGWRGAWVGFDVALLLAFASVAWTAWRGKQLLIVCLIVTATLLCCDAWFDLTLDWGTGGFYFSLLSAVVAELPLAILMALGARRLLRLTIATEMALEGATGPVPPLWQVALLGPGRSARDAVGPDGNEAARDGSDAPRDGSDAARAGSDAARAGSDAARAGSDSGSDGIGSGDGGSGDTAGRGRAAAAAGDREPAA